MIKERKIISSSSNPGLELGPGDAEPRERHQVLLAVLLPVLVVVAAAAAALLVVADPGRHGRLGAESDQLLGELLLAEAPGQLVGRSAGVGRHVEPRSALGHQEAHELATTLLDGQVQSRAAAEVLPGVQVGAEVQEVAHQVDVALARCYVQAGLAWNWRRGGV